MSQQSLFPIDYEVVVVGAGPAGLFCVDRLIQDGIRPDRILFVDAGKELEGRTCPPPQRSCLEEACAECDVLFGQGGPGLYLDCKLCIDNDAGAKASLKGATDYAKIIERLDLRIFEVLRRSGFETHRQWPGNLNYKFYERTFLQYQLDYHAYPVRSLGTNGARLLAKLLVSVLVERGVQILFQTKLERIEYEDDYFAVAFGGEQPMAATTKKLVLALGRSGTPFIETVAKKFDLALTPNALDIGVRIEFPTSVGTDVLATGANPKIKLHTESGSYAKTHCFCYGGEVISYRYQGLHLVDGHAQHDIVGKNSNVNLLYRYKFSAKTNPFAIFQNFASSFNLEAQGRIVAQRLGDFRAHRAEPRRRKPYLVEPTLPDAVKQWGNIPDFLPAAASNTILKFVDQLGKVFPGMAHDDNILYAPAAEWTMKQVSLSEFMETSVRGLYVVGDCAGISQGVLAAAASGVVAARQIAKELVA